MLDLETLGVTADATILSIGAVKFNMDGFIADSAFYAVCSIGSQPRRHISGDTLAWWVQQSESAKDIFMARDKLTLEQALIDLKHWFGGDHLLWSNGADFDIPMVNHALRTYDIEPLTKHWNHRCFRTLKEEYKMVAKPPFEGTQHNALLDAIHQAKWAQLIAEYKRGIKPPPAANGFAAAR
jgi:DNA polymerase III epsilon subunit-like protein